MASGLFRPLLFLRARSPRRLLVDRAGTIVLPLLDVNDVLELESLGCRRAAGAKLFISFWGKNFTLQKTSRAQHVCLILRRESAVVVVYVVVVVHSS
jgi:hypothetical protein